MNEELVDTGFRPPEGMLSPEQYGLLAGPPLKAAAQVAASRNDPDLFHDMASMLALLAMVTGLMRCYQSQADVPAESRKKLDAVPIAVCALVFARSGLAADEVKDCLDALSQAYRMLLNDGALDVQGAYIQQAYAALVAGDTPGAEGLLMQAAYAMVGAVDQWEWQRGDPGT